ncbi:MAG TPA: CbiX/SirB N-terminal domain-containing protein [Gemmatimonadales bacterium]
MAVPSSCPSPPTRQTGYADALLLVTAEACGAHAAVAHRLSQREGVDACVLPLGADASSALADVLARAPAHVVAVPLAWGASDPLPGELAGLLRWAKARWTDVPILESEPLGTREHTIGLAAQQVRIALSRQPDASSGRTALLVVGPGSASPAANAEVCAIARLLWEHGDYALVETAFLRESERRPSIAARIAHCRRLGMQRVVVVPLVLLDGSTARAVHAAADAARDADMDVVVAGPLLSPGGAAAVALERYRGALTRWFGSGVDGLALRHDHDHGIETSPAADALLPPRYRGGRAASAVPMRSAPLRYDDEGRVAWNEVWQSFCDLALAGGPPHRGTLLEPAVGEEVRADPEGYARVVAEIARGLSLITRLPVVTDAAPGWVGLVCPDDEMAVWLLRAITVENVCVRREGATLFLPAGPRYRVEKEIKNVITAVAKTHHYWTEHRAAR